MIPADLPPMIYRQLRTGPSWQRRVVRRVWKQRDRIYDLDRRREVPVFDAETKAIAPLSRRSKWHWAIRLLHDAVVAGRHTAHVLCLDARAPGGAFFVRIPFEAE